MILSSSLGKKVVTALGSGLLVCSVQSAPIVSGSIPSLPLQHTNEFGQKVQSTLGPGIYTPHGHYYIAPNAEGLLEVWRLASPSLKTGFLEEPVFVKNIEPPILTTATGEYVHSGNITKIVGEMGSNVMGGIGIIAAMTSKGHLFLYQVQDVLLSNGPPDKDDLNLFGIVHKHSYLGVDSERLDGKFSGLVKNIQLSRDGRRLSVTAENSHVKEDTVTIWDVGNLGLSDKPRFKINVERNIIVNDIDGDHTELSPTGTHFVYMGKEISSPDSGHFHISGKAIYVANLPSEESGKLSIHLIHLNAHHEDPRSFKFSPNGSKLAVGYTLGYAYVWDVAQFDDDSIIGKQYSYKKFSDNHTYQGDNGGNWAVSIGFNSNSDSIYYNYLRHVSGTFITHTGSLIFKLDSATPLPFCSLLEGGGHVRSFDYLGDKTVLALGSNKGYIFDIAGDHCKPTMALKNSDSQESSLVYLRGNLESGFVFGKSLSGTVYWKNAFRKNKN